MDIPTGSPCEFLAWAMSSAGVNMIVFGPLLSILVEYLHFIGFDWDSLDARLKRLVMLGLCLAVPFIGLLAGANLCGLVIDQMSIWQVLVAAAMAFLGSQMMHLRKLKS